MSDGDADRESAELNASLHEAGRLSCCGSDGSCAVDMWAKAYLAGVRKPYPSDAVLRQLRETNSRGGR